MSWEERAACGTADPEVFFAGTLREERIAKRTCAVCPVRLECLSYALSARVEHGVWGGLTDRERRAVARGHPGTTDWPELLAGDASPLR